MIRLLSSFAFNVNLRCYTPEEFPECVSVILAAGGLSPSRDVARGAVRTVLQVGRCRLTLSNPR
jgi:hypothetical protein